ncbi:MAG: LacI family DNA-binding transcriptional regulator [Victivallales bacterium]|nr:LacI family DNA-binding transcriptional regulator [Victivallales bacterium]
MRIGLKDIAEEAGVSVVTVSLALNGNGGGRNQARVSEAKRQEIRRIAERLGYRVSVAGRALKSKRLRDIGLLFLEESEQVRDHLEFNDLNIQVNRICRERGIRCQLEWFDPVHMPDGIPGVLTDGLIGGLLVAGNPAGASEEFLTNRFALPYVCIEEPGVNSVMLDIGPSLDAALERFAASGHRRVALINGPREVRRFREFADAFVSKAKAFGWADAGERIFTIPLFGDFGQSSQDAVEAIFNRKDPADAVLVASGQSKSVIFLIERMGFRVPDDVSVIHFVATDRESEKFVPRLSAIESQPRLLAENAVDILQELMETGVASNPRRLIPAVFHDRASVR